MSARSLGASICASVGATTGLKRLRSLLLWIGATVVLAFATSRCIAARPYQPVFGDPLREPWRWRSFADMNGLETQCIIEAKDGAIWFGTADGLSSYDGFEWKRCLASEGGVIAGWVAGMCNEPDGALDVAGWWGISQLRDGHWTRLVPAVGVRFGDVRRLAIASDGTLWAATSWGPLRRSGEHWTLYTDAATATRIRKDERYRFLTVVVLPEGVLAKTRPSSRSTNRIDLTELAVDAKGQAWFGTKGGEILRGVISSDKTAGSAEAPEVTWSLYNEADGLVSGAIPAILPVNDGSVWVVMSPSEKVNVFDGTTWRALPIPAPGVAAVGAHLLQTHDGVIWISARYVLFAYRDTQWQTYQKPDAPIPTALNFLLQSRDGALWIVGPTTDFQRIDYETPRWLTFQDLNFQWQSPNGAQWFLHRDGRVVLHEGDRWVSFGEEDGLMDTPVALLGARDGALWAAGSHQRTAATARFDGQKWTRETHPNFAWGIDWRALFESSDRSVWFGAAVDSSGPKQHRDGILQFREGKWIHHHQPGRSPREDGAEDIATLLPPSHRPEPIEKFACFGESADGKIWAGRNILTFYDGKKWTEFFPSDELRFGIIESMLTTRDREVWIGARQYGAARYDGQNWRQFHGKGNLLSNSIRSLAQTTDGSIWAATDRGFSRFDGNTWMDDAVPEELSLPHEGGSLKASPSGQLWINRYTVNWNQRAWPKATPPGPTSPFLTIRHQFAGQPPRTMITAGSDHVAQPGNISILWAGEAPWRNPKDVRLQFSFRLDNQPWSPFTSELGHAFFTLPSGRHHFEVRARDQDFNIDPTPATLDFTVLPPVWKQTWFIALMIGLSVLLSIQTFRVLLEKRRLQLAHDELENRVRQRTAQLEMANRELQSFSYSVSHDLRAPLRSIDGFSRSLMEDYEATLDNEGREDLRRIRAAAQRMGNLIDAMLDLARLTRGALRPTEANLSVMAHEIVEELARNDPSSKVEIVIAPDVVVTGDPALLRNVLQNLLNNAWKFTAKKPGARIEFGVTTRDGEAVYFVRDNGAGFDRSAARNLFGAFQRFHTSDEFPGTGIGLATVQRIIHRHGGRVEAESRPGEGAMFYFTLPAHTKATD